MEADQKMDVVYGDHVYQNYGNYLMRGITDDSYHLLTGSLVVVANLLPFSCL
jgi:hypothetical protein